MLFLSFTFFLFNEISLLPIKKKKAKAKQIENWSKTFLFAVLLPYELQQHFREAWYYRRAAHSKLILSGFYLMLVLLIAAIEKFILLRIQKKV